MKSIFAKFALAAALFAAVPLAGAVSADAAPGKNAGDRAAHAGKHVEAPILLVGRYDKRDRWDKRGHRGKRGGHWGRGGFGCVAVGKTINGRTIPGVIGRDFGPGACRAAMRECYRDLSRRQAYGKNPFGRCVVVSRR